MYHHTTLLRESFEVGIRVAMLFPGVLVLVTYIERFTEMSGNWLVFCWIWLELFGVCTFGSFTDWFVALLFGGLETWFGRVIKLFETTVLLFPVMKAGFKFGLIAWERLRFFCWSVYLAFYYLASSASLKATVLAIFRICWCLLFEQPKKLKFFDPCLTTLFLL